MSTGSTLGADYTSIVSASGRAWKRFKKTTEAPNEVMDQRDEHQYIVQPYQMSPYTTSSAGPLARQAGPTHKVARLWKLWQWGTIEVKHLFKGISIGWWWTETPKQKNKLWLLGPTSYTDLYQLSVVMNWPPPNMSHLQSWGFIRTMSQSTPNPKFQNTTAWFCSANRICQVVQDLELVPIQLPSTASPNIQAVIQIWWIEI